MDKNKLLQEWEVALTNAKHWQERELKLRQQVATEFFAPTPDIEGTFNYTLDNNWQLKAVFKQNYNIDRERVDAMLEKLRTQGAAAIADRIIKWSPSLSLTEYRQLSNGAKKIVDTVVTIKPATPSIYLIEPK